MATVRSHLDISWQQCHSPGSCDLCAPADFCAPPAVQAVTVRPAAVRPASAQPVRQVELQRDVIAEAEARVFADALECY